MDGKDSLHVTVGIAYQNLILDDVHDDQNVTYLSERSRRRYDGAVKVIPPFHKNLKTAKFKFPGDKDSAGVKQGTVSADDGAASSNQDAVSTNDWTVTAENTVSNDKVKIYDIRRARDIDLLWLIQARCKEVPMFNGFFSKFVNDPLPLTVIGYMDPISQSPTRNDVVRETMARSMTVAHETGMPYLPVTYDLAVALKAYSIQVLEAPLFDKLVILLGNFHLELAFFGALGTYIADSGLEYILTEAGVLAEGSLSGFLKGKHYNRCTRIHQLAATVLEMLLFDRFLDNSEEDFQSIIQDINELNFGDVQSQKKELDTATFKKLLKDFEDYLAKVMEGEIGKTAAFCGIYVYLVNRVHREIKRAVRLNDVELYREVLRLMNDIFFALNRPNYARWCTLFQQKLDNLDPVALDILKAGAFSTRRSDRPYSRAAIDLTLEQSINRDAASSATGITHFGNSDNAFRRWCVSFSQRSMAVTVMKECSGYQAGETPSNQLRKSRISRDNADMTALKTTITNICNPFSDTAPTELVNIATGKVASAAATKYLTGCLKRGAELKNQFLQECKADDTRLLKRVKKVKVENFAADNVKGKGKQTKKTAVESARDGFGNILARIGTEENIGINLRDIMSYPITDVPLSLAHTDGTPTKTEKATLTRLLEAKLPTDTQIPSEFGIVVFDGGLVLHEVLPHHNQSTYGAIVRDIISKVTRGEQQFVHLLLDKYVQPSIKDVERVNRGADKKDQEFLINSPDQKQRQKGTDLLKNGSFKEELASFLMTEVTKEYYAPMISGKTVFISHGGKCIKLHVTNMGILHAEHPPNLQAVHEEADTLICFHVRQLTGNILVRSSDTDVLVILLAVVPNMSDDVRLIMDFGAGNSRRFVDVTTISRELEKIQPGLSEAIIPFHALTGCDFTSTFYRKGKSGPLTKLEKSADDVRALRSLSTDIPDTEAVTRFVCKMYGFKNSTNINEVRHSCFLKMTGQKKLTDQVKKINCASLPPCEKSLAKHLQRVNYVSVLWSRAHLPNPGENIDPLNHGWMDIDDCYMPNWFEGDALPNNFTQTTDAETTAQNYTETNEYDEETEDGVQFDDLHEEANEEVWSGDSDSDNVNDSDSD